MIPPLRLSQNIDLWHNKIIDKYLCDRQFAHSSLLKKGSAPSTRSIYLMIVASHSNLQVSIPSSKTFKKMNTTSAVFFLGFLAMTGDIKTTRYDNLVKNQSVTKVIICKYIEYLKIITPIDIRF